MSAEGEQPINRSDPGWKYGFLADAKNKNDVTCNFCQKVTKGGIFRLKQHLAGGHRNVKGCTRCPEHVRQEIEGFFAQKKSQREQLDLVSNYEEQVDVDDFEDEPPQPCDRKGKRVMSTSTHTNRKSQRTVGPLDTFYNPKSTSAPRTTGRQTTVNEAYKKEARAKMAEDIARFVYKSGIPFRILAEEEFIKACDSIARAGIGAKPPTPYEVRVPLLKKEVARTDELLKVHRDEWARTGCSIMSDGWTDRCHRSLVNFMVNCARGSMFLESVDTSSFPKTGVLLCDMLCKVVEKVGPDNVVQLISDNGANFVNAGKLLQVYYPHIYWTPCAAHCVDLVLEDIGAITSIERTLKRAIHVSSYIYQRTGLLNLMRRFTGQRNLLRPGKTRFATSFITLSSIHKQQNNLRKLFQSKEWITSKWAKETGGKKAATTILSPTFWSSVLYILRVTAPLVGVLRLVDSEKKPAMGYIYEAMDRAKEAIAEAFKRDVTKYADIYTIIDKRWECQLHHPLHAAGYYLNPEYYYDNPEGAECAEVIDGLLHVVKKVIRERSNQDKAMEELALYKRAEGLFGNELAIRHRKTKSPADWWSCYGSSAPTLQQFAIKILSLTCSASGCERNWSTFEHIHTKKRNRIDQKRLNDLVYVKYNRTLLKRYEMRHNIDPISLNDIDESNEWLTRKGPEDPEDQPVYDDDQSLTWGQVASASGANDERFNLRSKGNKNGGQGSSQTQPLRIEEEYEEEEEDDEAYKSGSEVDGDIDAELALDDEDDLDEFDD